MKRTNDSIRIPDIINKSTSKNFTRVPNDMPRNPNISYKAKGILTLLLSNKDGWQSHMSTLSKMSADGISSIKTGLQELEREGYLLRVKYRDKKKKRIRGSFWIYTDIPGQFEDLEETQQLLDSKGMIVDWPENLKVENLKVENLLQGNQQLENHSLKRISNKKTNSKKTNTPDPSGSGESDIKRNPQDSKNNPSAKERNKKYLPLAKYLSKIVQKKQNIHHPLSQLKSWAEEIRKLHEINKVHPKRIKSALQWYKKNIGGQYVPVIESGASLRSKFVKLENAMKRGSQKQTNNHPKPKTGHYEPDYPFREDD
ncbi:MAG TPA: hypothetical protein VK982_11845, partial [Bacteroidales bacterium]|nr:hypothetical protein [Bacteroidales bacterium]